MTASPSSVVAGIDVGKLALDAHIHPANLTRRFTNDTQGRRALRNWLLRHHVTRAVFEPTGRYHRRLHQCLATAGLETVLVNPLRSRRCAEALGQCARNDRVDAAMLARFGLLPDLESTSPAPENRKRLNDLLALRTMLIKQRGALQKLLAELELEDSEGPAALLAANAAACMDCERRIRTCIAADPVLARRDAIIRSIPGLGPVTAASLCAALPELGTLGRRKTAALLGLAPFDRDSGQHHGHRRIRGGRAQPRHVLYMAATSAIRWNPDSQACHDRLTQRGKPHKVALVAVMRKLAGLLDTLLREDRLWQPEPPLRLPAPPLEAAA